MAARGGCIGAGTATPLHIGENMRTMARQLMAEWNAAVTLERASCRFKLVTLR